MRVNQDMYARVFRDLVDGPMTAHDAVEVSGMHTVTAQEFMRTLKRYKVVHIAAWEKDRLGRDATPVYALGAGRDKKRAKLTAAERQARHRARKKEHETQPVREVMGVKL